MKANKSVIMLCLLLFSISGNVFAQWENTGDVRIAEQSISKIDSLLKINLKIDLSDLAVQSNLAVDIIPVLLGRDEQTLRLPKLLVTGRNRHIVFQRMPQKRLKDNGKCAVIIRKNNMPTIQSVFPIRNGWDVHHSPLY